MIETSAMEFGFITSATLSASDDNVANGCVSFADKTSCTLTGNRCNHNVRKAASLIFSPARVSSFSKQLLWRTFAEFHLGEESLKLFGVGVGETLYVMFS